MDRVEGYFRTYVLDSPIGAAIYGFDYSAYVDEISHRKSCISVGEVDGARILRRAAVLGYPVSSAIDGFDDGVEISHNKSSIGIGEIDREKVLHRATILSRPIGAAIHGFNKGTDIVHSKARIGVGEMDRAEALYRAAVLRIPIGSAIESFDDGATNSRSSAPTGVDEVDREESMITWQRGLVKPNVLRADVDCKTEKNACEYQK